MTRWAWLGVAALIALVYLDSLGGDFVFDDRKLVRENEALWRLDARAIAGAALRPLDYDREGEGLDLGYRPLRFLAYFPDVCLTRLGRPEAASDPAARGVFWFHLINVALHIANALLMGFLGLRLGLRPPWACVAALVFGLHPALSESVAYISGRRELTATLPLLLALGLFWRGRGLAPWIGLLLFPVAYLNKELAITLPLLLALSLSYVDGSRGPETRRRWLPPLLLVAGLLAAYTWAFKNPTMHGSLRFESWGAGPFETCFSVCRALWHYVLLTFFPAALTVDYSFDAFPASRGLFVPWTSVPALLGTVGLAALALLAWRRRSPWGLALGWPLLALLPAAQILPHPERVAERFLYLPLVGVAWGVALAAQGLADRRAAAGRSAAVLAWGLALAILALGLRTVTRNLDWQSARTLWGSAVQVRPEAARARWAYGRALLLAGRADEAQVQLEACLEILRSGPPTGKHLGMALNARFDRGESLARQGRYGAAEAAFRELLAARDIFGRPIAEQARFAHVRHNLGVCLWEQGRVQEALESFESVLALEPSYGPSAYFLGLYHQRLQQWEKARLRFRQVGAADPYRRRARFEEGRALVNQGRHAEAETVFRELCAQQPDDPSPRYLLAGALVHTAGPTEVRVELEKVLELDPEHAAAHFSLGELLFRLRRWAEARPHFLAVLEQEPDHALSRRHLALIDEQLRGAQTPGPDRPSSAADPTSLIKAARHLLAARRELDEARRLCDEYLSRYPDDSGAWLTLARIHEAQGRADLALAVLDNRTAQATRGRPDQGETLLAARLLLQLARPAEARTRLLRGLKDIEGERRRRPLYLLLAGIDRAGGDLSAAEAWCLWAREADPDHADVWLESAATYLAQGRLQSARSAYERFLALEPQGPRAERVRARLASLETD